MFNRLKFRMTDLPKILAEADDATEFTPDIAELEKKKWQRFFFYDETMIDNRKYDLIKEHIVNWTVAYTVKQFHTWKKNIGTESFPIPFEVEGFAADSARIKGDLMSIESSHIPVLDKHKQNGLQFLRKRVPIVFPVEKVIHGNDGAIIQTVGHTIQRAWMYIAIPEHWESILTTYSFSKLKVHQGNKTLGAYTCFDKNEYVEIIKQPSTLP